jgi:hypothetical protein
MTTETVLPATTNRVRYGGDLVVIPNRQWNLEIIDGPIYMGAGGNGRITRWQVTGAEIIARWNHGEWTMDVKLEGNSVLSSGKLGSASEHIYQYKTKGDRLADVALLRLALADEYRPTTVIEITEDASLVSSLADELDDARWKVLTKLMLSPDFKELGAEAKTVLQQFRKAFRPGRLS